MLHQLAVGAALLVLGTALALHEPKQLPFCDPDTSSANDLVIVSTLDGKLTAFSSENGDILWDLNTTPLLSSNLHHVELTSGGKWVRLIPSLSGALYRLSGDSLEPLPLTAEQLLSSSFKYSNELVIAGARQTWWSGVEARTGRVVYRCGSEGCAGDEAGSTDDLLVLKHSSHTVRALDPRSGHEKWNFSVAEHQLAGGDWAACSEAEHPQPSLSLVLPDGIVSALREDRVLWRHKLAAPVADAWSLFGGRLQRIDVLQSASDADASSQPSLYIGMHHQQIYIQEGLTYAQRGATTGLAPIPWRPQPARLKLDGPDALTDTALQQLRDSELAAHALIMLYGKNMPTEENHGYFLTAADTTCDTINAPEDAPPPPDIDAYETHHHVHVHVYSLWFWWKEVLVIAVSSALLMNLIIWPRIFAKIPPLSSPLPISTEHVIVEHHYSSPPPPPPPLAVDYSSRYVNDFTPLRRLGRGGFGVVFECRNNIDRCHYAIKRITLPRKESKRQRVWREVHALANLEHENIVRYFNAWVEEPPPDWQRQHDERLLRELEGVSLSMTEDHDHGKQSLSTSTRERESVVLNLQKPQWEQSLEGQLGLPDAEHGTRRNRSLSCNDSSSIVFSENVAPTQKITDDWSVVFANSADVREHSCDSERRSGSGEPHNKHLDKVKGCESSHTSKKKKKTHRRHWSLDQCVRPSTADGGAPGTRQMYLYIQMQLCRRDSLYDWLRHNRARQSPQVVKSVFGQIVSAVEYVHLAGLIHRDLKPSNIFFAPDGKVKVGDFGLVTSLGDNSSDGGDPAPFETHATRTSRVGTHLYMSPEQMRGDRYDYKVDIYSLGLVLFELLEPFATESERVDSLQKLRAGVFPPHFRVSLPQESELLELMLSKDPARRPTAAGVRARAPLCQQSDPRWHFTLPPSPRETQVAVA